MRVIKKYSWNYFHILICHYFSIFIILSSSSYRCMFTTTTSSGFLLARQISLFSYLYCVIENTIFFLLLPYRPRSLLEWDRVYKKKRKNMMKKILKQCFCQFFNLISSVITIQSENFSVFYVIMNLLLHRSFIECQSHTFRVIKVLKMIESGWIMNFQFTFSR